MTDPIRDAAQALYSACCNYGSQREQDIRDAAKALGAVLAAPQPAATETHAQVCWDPGCVIDPGCTVSTMCAVSGVRGPFKDTVRVDFSPALLPGLIGGADVVGDDLVSLRITNAGGNRVQINQPITVRLAYAPMEKEAIAPQPAADERVAELMRAVMQYGSHCRGDGIELAQSGDSVTSSAKCARSLAVVQASARALLAAGREDASQALAFRMLVRHWNEFGPEHGFGELIDRLETSAMQKGTP